MKPPDVPPPPRGDEVVSFDRATSLFGFGESIAPATPNEVKGATESEADAPVFLHSFSKTCGLYESRCEPSDSI